MSKSALFYQILICHRVKVTVIDDIVYVSVDVVIHPSSGYIGKISVAGSLIIAHGVFSQIPNRLDGKFLRSHLR